VVQKDQEDCGQSQPRQIVHNTPYGKIPAQKMDGVVAQSISPESKSQYHKKRIRWQFN
jgi:hypothetical protein